MSAPPQTPGQRASTPRYSSGIPTPGGARSVSGIPTPGRSNIGLPRSSTPSSASASGRNSVAHSHNATDDDAMRALSEAIRANNPAAHRATPDLVGDHLTSARRSVNSNAASTRSVTAGGGLRPKTPTSATSTQSSFRTAQTPRSSMSASSSRPVSRQSDVFRASSRQGTYGTSAATPGKPYSLGGSRSVSSSTGTGNGGLEVGDPVRIESLGLEGTIAFLGEAGFKEGVWAGVELFANFAGRGKNDGSVAGVRYFTCAPNCGVFVAPSKLAPLSTRSDSVASGRFTPNSGRETPSLKPRQSYRAQPSTGVFKTPEPPRIAPGSRASKYVGLTAKQLSASKTNGTGVERVGSMSPTRAGGSRSPTRSVTSIHTTPKAGAGRPSTSGLAGPTPRRSLGGAASLATPRAIIPSSGRISAAASRGSSNTPPVPDLPAALLSRSPSRPTSSASSSRVGSGSAFGGGAKHGGVTPTLSQTSTDTFVDESATTIGADGMSGEGQNLKENARAIQERIARLMSSSSTMDEAEIMPPPPPPLPSSPPPHKQRTSFGGSGGMGLLPAATLTSPGSPDRTSRWQRRIAELENDLAEKNRLLESTTSSNSAEALSLLTEPTPSASSSDAPDAAELRDENARLHARITSLEAEINTRVDAARDEHDALSFQLRESSDLLDSLRAEMANNSAEAADKIAEIESEMGKMQLKAEEAGKEKERLEGEKRGAEAELGDVRSLLEKTTKELETDKRELAMEVDELRLAGQETIALYEEKLNNAEAMRYDLEDALKSLQEQLARQAVPLSKEELAARATTAAQIDNETLQEQVAHLQSKVTALEDQLHDARAAADTREELTNARMARFRENETQLKNDLQSVADERAELTKAEANALVRIQEVSVALQESNAALEDARAEIEVLRSDIAVLEAGKAPEDLEEAAAKAAQLEAQLEQERKQREAVASTKAQLEQQLTSLKTEHEDLASKFHMVQTSSQDHLDRISEMGKLLDQRTRELESARSSLSSSSREGTPKSANGVRSEASNLREQITGLKHVIQELTKENNQLGSTNKVLEKDNLQLNQECALLRESLERLEEAFEQKILQEHSSSVETSAEGSPLLQDVATLRQAMKDSQKRHEHEMDQMRKKLSDAEMEHTKAVNKLNHDLSDLEQLLEARIYKEDELEEEILKLKSDLRKATRSSGGSRKNRPSTNSTNSEMTTDSEVLCEACGKPGHDIATCDEVFNTASRKPSMNGKLPNGSDHEQAVALWCDDCESSGHATENCPYSQDVF